MKRILIFAFVAALLVAIYYFVFSKDEEPSYRKKTTTTSSEPQYLDNIKESDIQKQIFYTLPEKIFTSTHNGKVFCSSKLYGYDKNVKDNSVDVYLYAYCEEYYLKNNKKELGSGISKPAKLVFKLENQKLVFSSIVIPEDGNNYENSVKQIFPEKYSKSALEGEDISKLTPLPETQADNYYKGRLEVYF